MAHDRGSHDDIEWSRELVRAPTRFDESTARRALDAFEQRLRGLPFEILGIDRDTDVADTCVAFASIAAVHHPRLFTLASPPVAHRANLLYQKLRVAFQQHLASLERRRPTLAARLRSGDGGVI